MPDWVVPLSDLRFDEGDVAAVADIYRRGWLSQGPHVAAFEADLARYVGAREAVAVSSGTAALQLICAAIRIGPGDEVILPALTFAATAAAVVHAGATPVFADIRDPRSPWLSSDAAAARIGPRTRAIFNVSYAGHPGEVAELRSLAHDHGLVLIEDAAHALGGWLGERHAGTLGEMGAFSFFANKNLPLGEGGMVVTDDRALADRARLLRSHGLSSDTWARHGGEVLDYDVLEPGFNFRLDEARAALGSRLLRRLSADTARRALLADTYEQGLRSVAEVHSVIRPRGDRDVRCAWHIYPILLEPRIDRAEFRDRLHRQGVQTSVHYPPLHLTRAYSAQRSRLPVTEDYASRTVTLPMFSAMADSQQDHVLSSIPCALRASVRKS